jgi:hypothetical protein
MINRRTILLAPAALLAASTARASKVNLGDATTIRIKTETFLKGLEPEQTAEAMFPFGGEVQKRWNFMGTGGFIKPGVRLENMKSQQKDAAWDLLSAILSPRGIEKVRNVMFLQQVLIDLGSSPTARHPERYSLAIFGIPAPDQDWALRLEGHHLTLTFTVSRDQLVGVTPSSFSVNPNRVQGGSRKGLVTLTREDDLARKFGKKMQGSRAILATEPYRNIRATAGREAPFKTREGISVAELSWAQRELMDQITEAYVAEHLATPFATAVFDQIKLDNPLETTFFAYAGSTRVGEPAYYRIHGDRILIEFAAVDDAAQHLHTIFHMT